MNKPIRCTTHFHACDCREYEFEMLQKENEELKKDLEWVIDELNGFIADDDCPYYSQNIKSIKDTWLKGEESKLPMFNLSETPNSSKEGE